MKYEVLPVGTKSGLEFIEKLNQDYFTSLEYPKYANKKYNLQNYERGFHNIQKILIHCTATDSQKWDDPIACINYDLIPNHISKNGCPTATYHFYVDQSGIPYQLVSVYIKTWHCKNFRGRSINNESIAICINHGGEAKDVIEEPQYESLIDTICYVFDFMDWHYNEEEFDKRLFFHRDFQNKLCPGINLNKSHVKELALNRFETWGDVK